jgi:hypothetical protein
VTTPIDPMAAVKLLRSAIEKQIGPEWECNSDHPALREALRLSASIEQPISEAVYFARHATPGKICNEWTEVPSDRFQTFIDAGFVTRTLYTAPPALPPAEPDRLTDSDSRMNAQVDKTAIKKESGAPVDERAAVDPHVVLQALTNPYCLELHGDNWHASAHAWDEALATVHRAFRRAALQQPGLADKDVAMRRVGALMSNVMYNLGQHSRRMFTDAEAAIFMNLCKDWDAAVRAPSPQNKP